MNKNPLRNPFVALCDYASRSSQWCWQISCTTCGHVAFRIAFSKLVMNQHPDDRSFWTVGKEDVNTDGYEFYMKFKELERDFDVALTTKPEKQIKLASIVAESSLRDIQEVTKFPNWLGYIGLVLYHCRTTGALEILTKSLLSQFLEILPKDSDCYKYLKRKRREGLLLEIKDLEKIETCMAPHELKNH
ncbi:MAG TPA: hypothetical protein PLX95_02785 [bacterium]|nr:hypothetical protein [bacterium]